MTTLSDRITLLLSRGKTKEEIYLELLKEGHTTNDIQAGFAAIGTAKDGANSQKRTINMIVIIGALLVGAGIFSFIAANWQEMAKTAKVLIILVAMVVSYSMGWLMRERWNYAKTGGAFLLLGSLIYGGGIFLVAQMFNIRGNWPDGFILWMLGTLVMAFATQWFSLFSLAIVLGFIVVVGHPFDIFEGLPGDYFLFTSSFLLLIATLIVFVSGMMIRHRIPSDIKKLL